jgi:hypothetical protein
MFPWYNKTKLIDTIGRLSRNEINVEEIINEYVIPTQGQYMWMFGRVANFNTKANSDGSFNCTVKIVGPSEDSWSYSVRNTIVPARNDKSGKICPDGVNSVESYFTKTSPGKNFKTLLDGVINNSLLPEWKSHVIPITQKNKSSGADVSSYVARSPSADANISQESFADSEDAYFMTWRFFVNVVLNNDEYGVMSIFKGTDISPDQLSRISLIRPYDLGGSGPDSPINDEFESYIGNNKFLRSIDPSTLIIVNEEAVKEAVADLNLNRQDIPSYLEDEKTNSASFLVDSFNKLGDFHNSMGAMLGDGNIIDKGFLSTGVWVNHKAVAQSMVSSDTILRGFINLLDRMNSATLGFWQLTIDPRDSVGHMIIDMNYRENSDKAVSEFIDKVYTFNKYVRRDNTGRIVGDRKSVV